MQVAQTILEQLGGARRLSAMLGVKHFVSDATGALYFLFRARAKDGINAVRVFLTPDDLYTVVFLRRRTIDGMPTLRTIETTTGVYADSLRRVIEERTGLALSL